MRSAVPCLDALLPRDPWFLCTSYLRPHHESTERGKTPPHFVFEKAGHGLTDTPENVTTFHYADAIRYVTVSEPLICSSPPDAKGSSVGIGIIRLTREWSKLELTQRQQVSSTDTGSVPSTDVLQLAFTHQSTDVVSRVSVPARRLC